MTLVVLQYPAVLIMFVLCAVFAVLTGRSRRHSLLFLSVAGILGIAAVTLALICSIPPEEILLLLAGLTLTVCVSAPREEQP